MADFPNLIGGDKKLIVSVLAMSQVSVYILCKIALRKNFQEAVSVKTSNMLK
jgi:hypothetical protein